MLTEVTGRRFCAERIADDDMRAALREAGAGEAFIEAMVGMPIGLRGRELADQRTIVTTTPTTLGAWAQQHLSRPPM